MSVDERARLVLSGANEFQAAATQHYAELAADAPLIWLDDADAWLCGSRAIAETVLRSPTRYVTTLGWDTAEVPAEVDLLRRTYLEFASGDTHRHMRARTMKAMGAAHQIRIGPLVDELVAELPAPPGPVDLVRLLNDPLWRLLLRDWLGFDDEFVAEADAAIGVAAGVATGDNTATAMDAAANVMRRVATMVDAHRRYDTSTGTLLAALAAGHRPNDVVAARVINLTIDASPLPEAALLCLHNLIADPVARTYFARHSEDADSVRRGVKELLRRDPVQVFLVRYAAEDHQLADQKIAKGDPIVVLLGCANNDPRKHPDPVAFRPAPDNQDVTFGIGAHGCLGRRFAIDFVASMLTAVLRRFPDLTAAGTVVYDDITALRRLTCFPVTLVPQFSSGDANREPAREHGGCE